MVTNENFHTFTYITAAVRQTAKDTEFNYFFMLVYTKLQTFWYTRLYETITTNSRKYYYKLTHEVLNIRCITVCLSVSLSLSLPPLPFVCAYVCVYVHVCIYICVYICVCVCVCVCVCGAYIYNLFICVYYITNQVTKTSLPYVNNRMMLKTISFGKILFGLDKNISCHCVEWRWNTNWRPVSQSGPFKVFDARGREIFLREHLKKLFRNDAINVGSAPVRVFVTT